MTGIFGSTRRLPNVDAQGMGVSADAQPYAGVQFPPQQARPKRDGTKRIVGILGDALLGLAGQQGVYGPMQHQKSLLEAREAAQQRNAQQQRQWGNEDWMARQQWERANPKPVNNDTTADYDFIRQRLGDEAAATFLRNRADPPQYRQGPDGQFYRVETAQPPTAPVGRLTPIEPTMQNTPAPEVGLSGQPTTLTRQQYQAVVAAKGQAATDEWARRNNIRIGN